MFHLVIPTWQKSRDGQHCISLESWCDITATRDPRLDTSPITRLDQPLPTSTRGRPRKHPPMPIIDLTAEETILFDGFMGDFLDAYPDLNSSDYRLLWLAGIKYLQFLRLVKVEIESGMLVSMSRQHPAIEMRSLLDQLSVTRRARQKGKSEEDPDSADLRNTLLQLGQHVRRA